MRKSRKEDNTTLVGNMTAQDHYSLRWNNHQNHILRAFDALLQTKTLVDVTLVCAETSIRAHKMVLSACSPFFQRVFSETPCKHPVIVLKDFRGWVVQAIVDFMYRGEISVPQERLQTLIQAGESLQVRGLVENTTVPANTPTPAASPDDFGIMDTSMLASDLERCSNYDDGDTPPTMVDSSSKLILPSHVFPSDTDQSGHISNPDLCTSPMPRRKQARPRRRSGECAPHDLSKPSSPTPDDMEVKSESEKPEREDRSKCDDDGDDNDDDDDQNEEIRPPSSMDCEEVIPENETISRVVDNSEGPEDLCTKKDCEDSTQNDNGPNSNNNNNSTSSNNLNNNNNINSNNNNNSSNNHSNNNNNNDINSNNNNNNNNNNRIVLSLKDFRHISKAQSSDLRSPTLFPPHHLNIRGSGSGGGGDNQSMKSESMEGQGEIESPFHMEQMDLSMAAAAAAAAQHHHHQQHMSANNIMAMSNAHQSHGHDRLDDVQNRMSKEFTPSSPMSLPSHFNPPDGPPHPPSPLPFPGMSSALALTPQNMFGFDSPLGLFPPGMDPGKLYNPLMEMSDPRGLPNEHPPFIKKKSKYLPRPKGQHSAPRGGPPRSWTNAELTEALQHVWNKKMTTSQASRIFGIPYNSLLMYVRGKYGKSLKLEQLRKDCISGPPIELITMGLSKNADRNKDLHLKDLDVPIPRSSSSEPDLLSSPNPLFNPFPPGFYPDFPGGFPGLPLSMLNLLPPERHQPSGGIHMNLDEDCKSDRSKQSLEDDFSQPLSLARDERRELLQQNGQD